MTTTPIIPPPDDVPDITIRITVYERIAAFERLKREAAWQAKIAETPEDRLEALLWQDNAERNLRHWQAVRDREVQV
jgi:hypothetical protein